ncbi:DNA polymerase IV [Salinibius halmophilus]|uniref:DNA polymerase IV n=1 Tax=Salinibius halmophilus TaxID=1853216 RepID=UPI000E665062|nr:DNA polymerase IV [Salinibius halmophilus]
MGYILDSSTSQRRIIHIDCDCFFASVEQLDDPSLTNHPLAVGGASARSVLTTANYPARAFGVRSAMPTWQAKQKCPQLIIKPVRMQRYQEVSKQVMQLLKDHCDQFEQVSIDEAYLDVSHYYQAYGSATDLALWLQSLVAREVGITVSAGVSQNKLLAKLASDWRKPAGVTTISPAKQLEFLQNLPVKKFPGVGPKTQTRLERKGITLCQDVWQTSIESLTFLGNFATRLKQMSIGEDDRPVQTERRRKSVGVEKTLPQNLEDQDSITEVVLGLLPQARQRLAGRPFNHLSVKLKFDDFQVTTATSQCSHFDQEIIAELCRIAWQRQRRPVRLIGLQCQLTQGPIQLPLSW